MKININADLQIGLEEFLAAYGYGRTDTVYCRVFDDKDEDARPANLQADGYGLAGLEKELHRQNDDGRHGVFFVVNGGGQKDKEVKIARAQFVEIDDLPIEQQAEKIAAFPLEPSIIVRTRKSLHTYWLLENGDIKHFRAIQEALIAYFGGDPVIKNESRVMRLPGFKHNKQEPIQVRLIKFDPQLKYKQADLAAILPKPKKEKPQKQATAAGPGESFVEKKEGRHNAIMSLGGILRRQGLDESEIEAALRGYNDGLDDPLEPRELDKYIRDVLDYKRADDARDEAIDKGNQEHQAALQAQTMTKSTDTYIDAFIDEIRASKDAPYYSTGFSCLDKIIDDGLRPGLYTIGAISSLGKTTFALQIADYIAKSEHDVLYYSMEMSRRELMAKSISRETMAIDLQQSGGTDRAKTTLGILTGKYYDKYDDSEKSLIDEAIEAYRQYAPRIYIHEGAGNIGVQHIRAEVEAFIKDGKRPAVFIDYLQILGEYIDLERPNKNYTDKQAVDKNVLELRRISRDFGVPIICISSFNRDSYTEPVSMAAFKESGAVEYGSDVLIGLQYFGMEYKNFTKKDKDNRQYSETESTTAHTARVKKLIEDNKKAAGEGKPQQIQVKILKNRNGKTDACRLDFYPKFNRFDEGPGGTDDTTGYFYGSEPGQKKEII